MDHLEALAMLDSSEVAPRTRNLPAQPVKVSVDLWPGARVRVTLEVDQEGQAASAPPATAPSEALPAEMRETGGYIFRSGAASD